MRKKREVIGISATLLQDDLLGLMKGVEKLRNEYCISIREYEQEKWSQSHGSYILQSYPDPRMYEYDEDCRLSIMALHAVCDTEILCGRDVELFDVYDIVVNYKQLSLYQMVVDTAQQLEYLDSMSKYKIDETAECTRSVRDYNSMLRVRAWAFTHLKHKTCRQLTVDLISEIYKSTLIETLYQFRAYRTRSGIEYNYKKKVTPPEYIKWHLSKAVDEYNNGKDKTSNNQLILECHNPDGILNFIIDTSTSTGKLLFTLMSAIAQFERDVIADRTREGLAAARARGHFGGRPAVDSGAVDKALRLYYTRQYTVAEITELTGITKPTLYRYIEKANEAL